ncbi:MAG: C69 family dipeptidase [Erysipelotrichales bacterium]|nr:C69 family dipeptidase [Erysipelotrichales bacterium]
MSCTTLLVGKKASYDGSTIIARTDDGDFDVKKLIVVNPKDQPKKYKSVISHLEIELPDHPMRYTATPNVDKKEGIWAAHGINEANVAMTATETISTNALVMGADPYVKYEKAKSKKEKDKAGGIGEEDLVVLVLPYIHSAREGVERLAGLLEKYGTYEPNGIAFSDDKEIWWLETIGGHHWIARRVKDEEYVVMPNQFGIDKFDFKDAFGAKKEYMCSADLKEFIAANHLDCNNDGNFNPRNVFGSHTDSDHVYCTPRSWYMGRYFNPTTYKWDGPDADFTPESDNIPWSFVPERKITVEDVKYILSSYYQGTPYNPYNPGNDPEKGKYRSIGIGRTGVTAILQVRGYMPKEIQAVEWITFGSNAFNTAIPFYTNTGRMPKYVKDVTTDVSTENFFWASRLIGALADPYFPVTAQMIERYQEGTANESHRLLSEYDRKMTEKNDFSLMEKANEDLAEMAQKESVRCLNQILNHACRNMRNNYSRKDH